MRFLRWAFRVVVILAVLYLYFATLHPRQTVPNHVFFDSPGPWAIAHRGGRGLWPENTLYAFENALQLGVDVLEMDLRATADGAFVVIHDGTVDRTTDGRGRVDAMTLAEIRRLDAGHRFQDASGQNAFRGRHLVVPVLDEVLSRFSRARLNIEMKNFTPDLAGRLCSILKEHAATNRVLVAAFDHDAMSAFRRECPSVVTSATTREALTLYLLDRLHLARIFRSPAAALQVPETAGSRTVVEPQLLEIASKRNLKVQVWTVNDETSMQRLLDMGVHGIMTDYPDRLLRVMGRASVSEPGRGPLKPYTGTITVSARID